MSIVFVGVAVGFVVLGFILTTAYACCKVSGDISEEENYR